MASVLGLLIFCLLLIFTVGAYITTIRRQGFQNYVSGNFSRQGLLRNAYLCYAVGAIDFFFLLILYNIDGGLHTLELIVLSMSSGSFVLGYYHFHKKAQGVPCSGTTWCSSITGN